MSPELPSHNPEAPAISTEEEEAFKDSDKTFFPEGDFLKRHYWGIEEFRSIVESSAKKAKKVVKEPLSKNPEQKIPHFLDRLEAVLQDREGRSRKEGFSRRIYSHFVIKPQDIPEDYFRNVLLGNFAEKKGYQLEDLKNPQIRTQIKKQFQQETNYDIDTYEIPKDQLEELTEQIISDQERSFDVWLNYLTSPEAENYPRALKYWALAEAVKLGPYDSSKRKFSKREKNTVAPLPELNPQALALSFDFISKKYAGESISLPNLSKEQKEALEKAIASESFASLYAWSLEYVRLLRLPEQRLAETRGEWRVFPRGSDPKALTQQLQGFSTGWCIAAEGTAQSYLTKSDIHIFYSLDEKGKPTIPRAAIVTDGETISEVRGIANSQNIDSYITPTVDSKLKQMPEEKNGRKKWNQ